MKLQVIYTLEKGQEIANFDFYPEIIETQKSFIDYCLNALAIKYAFADSVEEFMKNPKEKQVPIVYKLSGCICLDGEEYNDEPKWWAESSGKVYLNQPFNEVQYFSKNKL